MATHLVPLGVGTVRLALVALTVVFGAGLKADDAPVRLAPPDGKQAFAIVSQSPELEVRFRGLTLRTAHTDKTFNRITLDFGQTADSGLFARLQSTLPGWIAMAYAGPNNAVIEARNPVRYMMRDEDDGFSIRFIPADSVADLPLRGGIDQPTAVAAPGVTASAAPLSAAPLSAPVVSVPPDAAQASAPAPVVLRPLSEWEQDARPSQLQ